MILVATSGAGLVSATSSFITHVQEKPKQVELPARIQTLTKSLNSAAETIGQIEDEIARRRKLVEQLQRDADTAAKLSALNKDQMDAVAQVLRTEIKSDQSQNFWNAQMLAFFYAALGVALSEGYRFITRWRLRQRLQSEA
jgi:uncharacterized membrane protein YdfJ with MMPL/SSD domain